MTTGKMTLVENSSVIAAYIWYSKSGTLTVRYKNGDHYQYKHVDQATYDALEDATSKGRFINSKIKNNFESVKVDSSGHAFASNAVPLNDTGPWPFPTGPRPDDVPPPVDIPAEDLEEILKWTPDDEQEFLNLIDKE